MTSLFTALSQAQNTLTDITDSPRLEAEILLSLAINKPRTHLRAWPDKLLATEQENQFNQLLEQRLQGRPIAYIVGHREFWSREFLVTADVLIPRPETELLVELALERMPANQTLRIADLGTGSGAIAITLALERPLTKVMALDYSSTALTIAKQNASRLQAKNIEFLQSDWLSTLPCSAQFDLIVSNPPYIAENDPHLTQGDVRFEPRLALTSGAEGLDAIRQIIQQAPSYLVKGGWLLFEHGYDQADAAQALLRAAGFYNVASFRDWQGHWRVSGGQNE
jgi:release factor glutamine methyltransferase